MLFHCMHVNCNLNQWNSFNLLLSMYVDNLYTILLTGKNMLYVGFVCHY